MIHRDTLAFLRDLRTHNNRAWFKGHRDAYLAAKADVIAAVDELIGVIAEFDPPVVEMEPDDALFRINRDTRFSKDKSPYKTNFGAFLTDRGRRVDRAGYYLHIEPRGCFFAGGLYMPPAPQLKAVRRAILRDAAPLRRILKRASFARTFGAELPGARLRTAPRDVPRDHPDIDLLRLKSFEVVAEAPDAVVTSKNFRALAAKTYREMSDFVKWLNAALDASR